MKKIEKLLADLPQIKGKRIYIWGAGNTAMLFREGLSRIPQLRIEAFIDSDLSKQNKTVGETPIISADNMIADENTFVLICTGQPAAFTAISKQLSRLGIASASIDAVIFGMFSDEVKEASEVFTDEDSRELYLRLLEKRIHCQFPDNDMVTFNQYFCLPKFNGAAVGETFIDCGAYVGDSVERYIWAREGVFGKIIAFEPDRQNNRAMNCRLERLKKEWNIADDRIECYPYGISDSDSTQYIESYDKNNGLGSKIASVRQEDAEECRTVTLEHFIRSSNCFLKADIESYEYRMLQGAANAIRTYKPKMAVCIYHNAVDFFTIPLLVRRLVPEYQLSIRHHSSSLSDTVLYAYI